MPSKLSIQFKEKLIQRDGCKCYWCETPLENKNAFNFKRKPVGGAKTLLTIDHVIPICDGGETSETNLVIACYACNIWRSKIRDKSNRKMLEDRKNYFFTYEAKRFIKIIAIKAKAFLQDHPKQYQA